MLPRKPSFDTYGGLKRDYAPIVNPETDRTSVEVNAAFYDLSQVSLTAPRSFIHISPSTNEIVLEESQWPDDEILVEKSATGRWKITYPSTVFVQPFVITEPNLVRGIQASVVANSGGPFVVSVSSTTSNIFFVSVYSLAGALVDPAADCRIQVIAY